MEATLLRELESITELLVQRAININTENERNEYLMQCDQCIELIDNRLQMGDDLSVEGRRDIEAHKKRINASRRTILMNDLACTEQLLRNRIKTISSNDDRDTWLEQCNQCIDLMREQLQLGKDLSTGVKSSFTAMIARFKSLRVELENGGSQGRTDAESHASSSSLIWEDVESAFKSRITTGIIINTKHIDPRNFLEDAKEIVFQRLREAFQNHSCIKVNTVLYGEFTVNNKSDVKSFSVKNEQLFSTSDLNDRYDKFVVNPTLTLMEEFQERDSGWALSKILHLMLNINKCNPMHAGCYIDIPKKIKDKKAIVNVKVNDNTCFARSIVAMLHPPKGHVSRPTSYPEYDTVLNLKGITFPVTLDQISKFEQQNDISINVYFCDCEGERLFPLRLTTNERSDHVDLLMLENFNDNEQKTTYHFAGIKNLSRLFSSQLSNHKGKVHICNRCLHYFYAKEKLLEHKEDCMKMNDCRIILPSSEDRLIKFHHFYRRERHPFIVYADFECLLKKLNVEVDQERRYAYQQHEAYSVGYYFHCSYDPSMCEYRAYRGTDCATWFVHELEDLVKKVAPLFDNIVPMRNLTDDEKKNYTNATHCYICEKPFDIGETKVRDHCHFTGRYRGPAHQECNLNYKSERFIPIVFHNLSGYDAHFVIKELATIMEGSISVLPITKEKYISFSANVKGYKISLRFIDSFRFLNSSLDKLSSYLGKDDMTILRSQFKSLDEERFDLLTRKGIFPYDYVTDHTKLNETTLPTPDKFYNQLSDCAVSQQDYEHAIKVWRRFNIKTLGEYSDLYLKTDVLLLADIFENFRGSCLRSYKLDPAYYYTLPGFTWDAMLKHTRIELELLTDIDMLLFIERGIRGGLSQCSNRYAKANNKYMDSYKSEEPSRYLVYFDVNNLYGWAMSQYLPYGKFEWLNDNEIKTLKIDTISEESGIGYILEVDLEYPPELHDKHADLPFCPIRKKPPNAKHEKLLATVQDKQRYIVHYRNLQQCLKHGLKVSKTHRVLKFKQSPWLRGYIDLNTRLRTEAKNDFEKNLFKLMNNAVFGKTMENVRNHVDVKLVTKWEGRYGAEALIAKPNFHSRSIFSEHLIAIEMRKLEIKFKKPIYVGMCILDISKTCLYEFHHDYVWPQFKHRCKVLYTDTDSLIYELECDDIYDVMKHDIHRFDTSDYPEDNVYDMPRVNKKVPGLMKDENNGRIMTEFVGLRSKMYALRVEGKEDTKKVKGVKSNVIEKTICFDHYVRCLNDGLPYKERIVYRKQRYIRSKSHNVYSVCEEKEVLNPDDDKRFIIPHSTRTLPWGHYKINDYSE